MPTYYQKITSEALSELKNKYNIKIPRKSQGFVRLLKQTHYEAFLAVAGKDSASWSSTFAMILPLKPYQAEIITIFKTIPEGIQSWSPTRVKTLIALHNAYQFSLNDMLSWGIADNGFINEAIIIALKNNSNLDIKQCIQQMAESLSPPFFDNKSDIVNVESRHGIVPVALLQSDHGQSSQSPLPPPYKPTALAYPPPWLGFNEWQEKAIQEGIPNYYFLGDRWFATKQHFIAFKHLVNLGFRKIEALERLYQIFFVDNVPNLDRQQIAQMQAGLFPEGHTFFPSNDYYPLVINDFQQQALLKFQRDGLLEKHFFGAHWFNGKQHIDALRKMLREFNYPPAVAVATLRYSPHALNPYQQQAYESLVDKGLTPNHLWNKTEINSEEKVETLRHLMFFKHKLPTEAVEIVCSGQNEKINASTLSC